MPANCLHLLLLVLITTFSLKSCVFSKRNDTINVHTQRTVRSLPSGRYCSKRGCCPGRDDDCIVAFPEMNAMCYCDLFCGRYSVGATDCCPDFLTFCLSGDPAPTSATEKPPTSTTRHQPRCIKDGMEYEDGFSIKENCNYCTCKQKAWICTKKVCLVHQEMIQSINSRHVGWTASNYSHFWGMTLDEGIRYRLGTIPPSANILAMNAIKVIADLKYDMPEFFIASYKWPGWIHGPLDQHNCAASWAFSTATVAADRIAIHSMGRRKANLSPQNLISCDTKNQNGCSGGRIDSAWWYLRHHGLVSNECYPFSMDYKYGKDTCMMASRPAGNGKRHATMTCPNSVVKSNEISLCTPPYRIPSNETEIMKEILENGPVQAVMQVHGDFFLYKEGIYRYTNVAKRMPENDQKQGTHSVKLTGWGHQKGPDGKKVKFWIATNSWGKWWGENGSFRIVRGENESGIEQLIIGVWGQSGPN